MVACVVAVLAAAGSAGAEHVLAAWDFSEGTPLGWRAAHDLEPFRFERGALILRATGTDPYAVGPPIEIDTTPYQYLRLDLESSVEGSAELFWASGPDRTGARFHGDDRRGFRLRRGRGSYIVVPFWRPGGKVWRIRLDPPGAPRAILAVRRITMIARRPAGPAPEDLAFDFDRPEEARWWIPLRDVGALRARDGALVAEAEGPEPAVLAPPLWIDLRKRPYLSLRLAAPGAHRAALFLRSTAQGPFSPAFHRTFDLIPGRGPHTYNLDLRGIRGLSGPAASRGSGPGRIHRIAIAARGARRIEIDAMRAAEAPRGPAEVGLVSVEPRGSVVKAGGILVVRVKVRNHGGTRAGGLAIRAGFDGERREAATGVAVDPIATETVRLRLSVPADPGRHVLSVELAGAGGERPPFEREITVVEETAPLEPGAANARVVDAGPLRLVVSGGDGHWTAGVLWLRRAGTWARVGAFPDLGRLEHAAWKGALSATEARAEGGGWVFRRRLPGATCETAFHPERARIDGAGIVRVRLRIRADEVLAVRDVLLPGLRIGDGSFGAAKDVALLPGLEYALDGERTSGTDFCAEAAADRLVPHPYKVTAPIAAVLAEGVAAGWMWDPRQPARPSILFASPNFLRGEANHLATLVWPGVGDGRRENALRATEVRILAEGTEVTIEAALFAMAAGDVDGPMALWIARRGGLPDPPPVPLPYARTADAIFEEVTRVAWVEREGAWHRALPDPWGPAFLEANAVYLLWRLRLPPDAAGRKEAGAGGVPPVESEGTLWRGIDAKGRALAQDVLDRACRKRREARPGGPWGPDLAFHLGGVEATLRGMRARARRIARDLREDGSIPFRPDPRHAVFGRRGDSSSGLTARAVRPIAAYARVTGDREAVAALRRALVYVNACRRPEGAQTWELPLHVPDVLAAADAVALNVVAYEETGDEAYLRAARRWAFRALPFLYLWNPDDRPVMRYGSIPVFGATWYTSPWFGRIVQWNGLVLADALLDLAAWDGAQDWAKVARGIVYAAIGQARPIEPAASPLRAHVPDCGHTGMYPDAYSAVKGTDAYHWCLSGLGYLPALARLEGESPWRRTEGAGIGARRVRVTAPGRWLERPRVAGGMLRFTLRYPEGRPFWVLVAGPGRTEEVRVGGRVLGPLPEGGSAFGPGGAANAGTAGNARGGEAGEAAGPWTEESARAALPGWRLLEPEGWLLIRARGEAAAAFEIRIANS